VGLYFRSVPCAVVSFASGVLIDIDHFLDYYLNHGFSLNLKNIYDVCASINVKKIYVFFHSYELVLIIWLIIFAAGLPDIWKAVAIGLTQHITFDQFTNRLAKPTYLLTYRFVKGFDKDAFIKKESAYGSAKR
jgi:hypothetical protein